ncbi:MAG TPA: MSMEG_0568 family radical SAM protein [Nonomuraea sp.]|uniref:MSMEG_0568 family radical SAM protein n=1 Tax=Nonomuraea sp. NPDC049649 TaxID=3155776 RepID=UPI002C7E08FE|nr:MSMEG_0568 family radical SAM protein [Nonomuraea sp.]
MTEETDTHRRLAPGELAELIVRLQSLGLRTEVSLEARKGGAGPSDAGMLYIDGSPATVPTTADYVKNSPYALRQEDDGFGIYEGSVRLADASLAPRPKYYDMKTEDGIPYWQIALMHLDSMASTVLQTCAYWGNSDQCTFCGIGVSLAAGRTIAKKTPEMLAEVAVAARDLDGAVDATLTTGSTATPDRGALYVGRCAQAVKEAAGLPVQVQFEPPSDLDVINQVRDMGVDSVGIHVETFDPEVLARVAPGKARWGIETYFSAWERAVEVFGEGQVSTYVILGMGEDPKITVDMCRRAVDMGVYPFIVPLRPVPGSLMESEQPPSSEYVESIYRQVVPHMVRRGLTATGVMAGCARCQACSAQGALERAGSSSTKDVVPDGRVSLPLVF